MPTAEPTGNTVGEGDADANAKRRETSQRRQEVVRDIAALVVAEHRRRQSRKPGNTGRP